MTEDTGAAGAESNAGSSGSSADAADAADNTVTSISRASSAAPTASQNDEAPQAAHTANDESASDAPSGSLTADQARIALRRVKDPELNLNIVDLGLVYDVSVTGNNVHVDMSLTSPGCPSGPEIMGEAEQQLKTLPGVGDVVVNLVWTPPWTPERIEPRVRAYMGF